MTKEWYVESVSDDGVVLIVFPDGERCTITVASNLVPKFRRIVELNRAPDERTPGLNDGPMDDVRRQ